MEGFSTDINYTLKDYLYTTTTLRDSLPTSTPWKDSQLNSTTLKSYKSQYQWDLQSDNQGLNNTPRNLSYQSYRDSKFEGIFLQYFPHGGFCTEITLQTFGCGFPHITNSKIIYHHQSSIYNPNNRGPKKLKIMI